LPGHTKAVAEKDAKALVDYYESDAIVRTLNVLMMRGPSALGDLF
jgi:hypothetical protein